MAILWLPFASESFARSSWPTVLKLLNQEPSKPYKDFSSTSDKDFLGLYKSELSAISSSWAELPESKKDGKSTETKRLTNEYFHKRIGSLNAALFAGLDPNLAVGKDFSKLADDVLTQVQKNPVANLEATQNYDPSGQVGFCFGRALLVHHQLLKAGVKQEDIAKIFAAGQLRVAQRIWNFHVAVMVRDAKHGFLVIDPLYEKPLSLKAWTELTEGYDIKGTLSRARFYISDPRRFLPSGELYAVDQFENKYLKSYFDQLVLSMK
jgi:hypothetical protein